MTIPNYTFTPDPENKRWLEHAAIMHRRSQSAQLNIVLEKARLEDPTFPENQS